MRAKSVNPLAIIAAILVLVLTAVLVAWFFVANVVVNWHAYPKTAKFLNLRSKDISVEEYETLSKKLPYCEIYWSVPFQGERYYENIPSLRITSLTEADVDILDHFTSLDVIDAEGCTDYALLAEVQNRHPDTEVRYSVTINDTLYALDATEVTLGSLADEELELLRYLPALQKVDAGKCDDVGQLEKMQEMYPHLQFVCTIGLNGEEFDSDAAQMTVTGMTEAEAKALGFFSNLKELHLVDPEMEPQTLKGLREQYPNVSITWQMDVLGVTLHSEDTELELMEGISKEGAKAYEMAASAYVKGDRDETVMLFAKDDAYPVPDLTPKTAELISQVETALAYFPNVEYVSMRGAFLDNEAMAAFREAHREEYKVVWTVNCNSLVVSTDTTYVMPYKYGVAYFFDEDTYNLRYCEDVICVDVGHMAIHNCDFAQYMPKLKYLILAHTQIKDITPLQHCKSLVFLELDWGIVRDYTPLLGCTALEDLNVGMTYADVTPLLKMTWLKHLWIIDRSVEVQMLLTEAFENTETELYMSGMYTAGGGWRNLPNYYAMRDAMNMFYMEM